MMKVFGFVVIVVSLVVGVISSSEDSAQIVDTTVWGEQCRAETGFNPETADRNNATAVSAAGCYAACRLEKAGVMKDGTLVEREKACQWLAGEWSNGKPKEGRTILQLAEKCYDEAKVKTEKCEIGFAVVTCLEEGVIGSSEVSSEESIEIVNKTERAEQCRAETGINLETADHNNATAVSAAGCYVACLMEKSGWLKDGRLEGREKVSRELAADWRDAGTQPKEGRTFVQLAEKCYDEAKVKTEKCEIGLAVGTCLAQGSEKVKEESSEEQGAVPRLG